MKKEVLLILSESPGRIRLKYKKPPSKIPDIEPYLDIKGVEEVTYNKISNSILIVYDKTKTSSAELKANVNNEIKNVVLKDIRESRYLPQGNKLSQNIYQFFRNNNKTVNRKLKGSADLTSLIPLVLLVWAIEELIRNPVMPKWYDIFRVTESMFMQFRNHYHDLI